MREYHVNKYSENQIMEPNLSIMKPDDASPLIIIIGQDETAI